MKNALIYLGVLLVLTGCQTITRFPADIVPSTSEFRHSGRINYSSVEAQEDDEDSVCVGVWCGCPSE